MQQPRIGDVVIRKGASRRELVVDVDEDLRTVTTAWESAPRSKQIFEARRRSSTLILCKRGA